jgi:hypothetical protein
MSSPERTLNTLKSPLTKCLKKSLSRICNASLFTTSIQKGVLSAGALEKNAEKKQVPRVDEFVDISRTPFYHKEKM